MNVTGDIRKSYVIKGDTRYVIRITIGYRGIFVLEWCYRIRNYNRWTCETRRCL